MKKLRLLALLGLVLAFSSCSTARFYSGFSADTASQGMILLGPSALHFYLDEKNQASLNDSLSFETQELLASLVSSKSLPVTRRVQLDSAQHVEAAAFMDYLKGQTKMRQKNSPIPTALDELLEAEGERYGLLLFAEGMSRDRKGYKKAVTKGALLGLATAILTLGAATTYSVPVKTYSGIYAAVLDAETNQIVFYNFNEAERSPLDPGSVSEQLERMLAKLRK